MPWNDKPGGSGGGGPWGGGGNGGGGDKGPPGGGDKTPWGRPSKPSGGGGGGSDRPDLEESLRRMQERFRRRGGGGNGGGNKGGPMGSRGLGAAGVGVIVAVAFVGWLFTGVYQVSEQESAVVLRFGVPDRTEPPGFHIRWPSPIEDHIPVKVNRPNATDVGSAEGESLMLTGDEKIIDVDFVVNWKVNVPQKYLFNVVNEDNELIKQVAESAMREVIGTSAFDGIITNQRIQVEDRARNLMQQVLNAYDAGIEIQSISMKNAQAPGPVRDAQLDVSKAEQDRATSINQAEQYRSQIVPKAKGEAQAAIQQAEGYRDSRIAIAEGEAQRFRLLYDEYRQAPKVTRDRMFLETMTDIIKRVDTTIIDTKSGAVPILPLDQLRGRTAQ